MIINNIYFKGSIYIPHAKPSVTDNVTTAENRVFDFINIHSRECLIDCLGLTLFLLFEAELDSTQPNLLKVGSDAKWDELLNGKTYTQPGTDLNVRWKGIRYKSAGSGAYDMSFLADYVYFFYESNDFIKNAGGGHNIQMSKNAELVSPTHKVVNAWRRFYKEVHGNHSNARFLNGTFGLGVDYYNQSSEICFYQFIKDMNTLTEDTYPDFCPKVWTNMNHFGI